jgi:hypothetical protein
MVRIDFVTAFPKGTSRTQGEAARKWLRGLVDLHKSIELDLDGVELITPSFADECFGKLLKELGQKDFRSRLQLRGGAPAVQQIVNHVLRVRLSESVSAS